MVIVFIITIFLNLNNSAGNYGGSFSSQTTLSLPSTADKGDVVTVTTTTTDGSNPVPLGDLVMMQLLENEILGPSTDGSSIDLNNPVFEFSPSASITLRTIRIPIIDITNVNQITTSIQWKLSETMSGTPLIIGDLDKNELDDMIMGRNLLLTIGTFQTDVVSQGDWTEMHKEEFEEDNEDLQMNSEEVEENFEDMVNKKDIPEDDIQEETELGQKDPQPPVKEDMPISPNTLKPLTMADDVGEWAGMSDVYNYELDIRHEVLELIIPDECIFLCIAASTKPATLKDWERLYFDLPLFLIINIDDMLRTQSLIVDGVTIQGFNIIPLLKNIPVALKSIPDSKVRIESMIELIKDKKPIPVDLLSDIWALCDGKEKILYGIDIAIRAILLTMHNKKKFGGKSFTHIVGWLIALLKLRFLQIEDNLEFLPKFMRALFNDHNANTIKEVITSKIDGNKNEIRVSKVLAGIMMNKLKGVRKSPVSNEKSPPPPPLSKIPEVDVVADLDNDVAFIDKQEEQKEAIKNIEKKAKLGERNKSATNIEDSLVIDDVLEIPDEKEALANEEIEEITGILKLDQEVINQVGRLGADDIDIDNFLTKVFTEAIFPAIVPGILINDTQIDIIIGKFNRAGSASNVMTTQFTENFQSTLETCNDKSTQDHVREYAKKNFIEKTIKNCQNFSYNKEFVFELKNQLSL